MDFDNKAKEQNRACTNHYHGQLFEPNVTLRLPQQQGRNDDKKATFSTAPFLEGITRYCIPDLQHANSDLQALHLQFGSLAARPRDNLECAWNRVLSRTYGPSGRTSPLGPGAAAPGLVWFSNSPTPHVVAGRLKSCISQAACPREAELEAD